MRSALRHDYALNRCATARTGLAILLVDLHVIVVLARLAPQIAILVERRPAMLDAQRQDRDDAVTQQTYFVLGKRGSRRSG